MTPLDDVVARARANGIEIFEDDGTDVLATVADEDDFANLARENERLRREINRLLESVDELGNSYNAARDRIERQSREILELQDSLTSYQAREMAIIDLIHRHQREDAYRRIHMRVNQVPQSVTDAVEQGRLTADQPLREYHGGLGGVGIGRQPRLETIAHPSQCDCTMGRAGMMYDRPPFADTLTRMQRAIVSMAKLG